MKTPILRIDTEMQLIDANDLSTSPCLVLSITRISDNKQVTVFDASKLPKTSTSEEMNKILNIIPYNSEKEMLSAMLESFRSCQRYPELIHENDKMFVSYLLKRSKELGLIR